MNPSKKILLAAFALGIGWASAQTPISLQQLQTATNKPGTEGAKARQVGVTNAQGKQRYVAFPDALLADINYTPPATGNTVNLSRFVSRHDSIWFIDYEGDAKFLAIRVAGAGTPDQDWLKVRNNGIPYAITDTIYTDNIVAINGRNYFPDVELNVYDSASIKGAAVAAIGNRGGRFAGWNTVDGKWTSYGQEGSLGEVIAGGGTTKWAVYELTGGGTPGDPTGTFEEHFSLDLINNNALLPKYASPRNDAGKPTSLASYNSLGQLERHGVYELKDSLGLAQPANQIVFGTGPGVSSEAAAMYDPASNRLTVDSVSGKRAVLTQPVGNVDYSLQFKGNQEKIWLLDNDSRNTATMRAPFNFVRSFVPAQSTAGDNEVYYFGINEGDGARPRTDLPGMGIRMEANYQNSPSVPKAFEFHLPQVSYVDGNNRRPITGYFSNDPADRRGNFSFQTDHLIVSDYHTKTTRAIWGIATNSGYDKGLTFLDTARIFFAKNGKTGGGMYQRNAAGTAYMGLLYAHSDNYAVIGDDGAGVRIYPGNLEIGSTGEIFATNAFLLLGKSGKPNDVRILSNSTEALRLTAAAQPTRNWQHVVNADNYALISPTGAGIWQFYDNGPVFTSANNRFSIGGFGTSKFSVVQSATNSEAGMQLQSAGGSRYYWWLDSNDDFTLTNNSGQSVARLAQNGDFFLNRTGAFKPHSGTTAQRPTVASALLRHNTTTGQFEGSRDGSTWENFLMGSGTTAISSLAAVGSTPNANAATLTGSTLNLEPASSTHPGVVTASTQTFAGQKTFAMSSGGGVTQNIILDNTATAAVNSAVSMAHSVAGTQRGEVRTTLTEIVGGGADFAQVEVKAQDGGALKTGVLVDMKNSGIDNVSILPGNAGSLTMARREIRPYSTVNLTGNATLSAGYSTVVLTGTMILTDTWTVTLPASADMVDGEVLTITNSIPGVTGATLNLTANSGQTFFGFTGNIGFANPNGFADRKVVELMFTTGGTWRLLGIY